MHSALAALCALCVSIVPAGIAVAQPPPIVSTGSQIAPQYETRLGEEGFVSPNADLSQMDWLIGQWRGTGIGGAPAMESWLPPTGGTMVGTFIQQNSDKTIQFTEHMYLMEEEGTLVLRLKHFNADLTGWEEKDGMLTFRLVAIEPCAAYFHALTLRCEIPGAPSAGLVVAVRMKSASELKFRFWRDDGVPDACPDTGISPSATSCLEQLLENAEAKRKDYLAAALKRYRTYGNLAAMITASDAAFIAYREAECAADAEWYRQEEDPHMANYFRLTCALKLTDARTLEIWENYLTYLDATSPVLPEPVATR